MMSLWNKNNNKKNKNNNKTKYDEIFVENISGESK